MELVRILKVRRSFSRLLLFCESLKDNKQSYILYHQTMEIKMFMNYSNTPVLETAVQSNLWPCSSGLFWLLLYSARIRRDWPPVTPLPKPPRPEREDSLTHRTTSQQTAEELRSTHQPFDLKGDEREESKDDPDDGTDDQAQPEDTRLCVRGPGC